jgi:hypothetical protein
MENIFNPYNLTLWIGWSLLIIVIGIAAITILHIATGKIAVNDILSEPVTVPDPQDATKTKTEYKASLSRLQFLIFTFVISLCLFLTVARNLEHFESTRNQGITAAAPGTGTAAPGTGRYAPLNPFPEIPATVLALLGISGGSFLLSKGIQVSQNQRAAEIAVRSRR